MPLSYFHIDIDNEISCTKYLLKEISHLYLHSHDMRPVLSRIRIALYIITANMIVMRDENSLRSVPVNKLFRATSIYDAGSFISYE